MYKCLVCETEFDSFMTFGKMPIANGFLTSEDFKNEFFYELEIGACPNCSMVQLVRQPEREMMFHEDYAFFSSTSEKQRVHFKTLSDEILDLINANDPFVVEIGCNDGIMLEHISKKQIRHLGIEPSTNVAEVAADKGVNTISEFFDYELAKKIKDEYGNASVISASNVMCHIPYLDSVVKGVKELIGDSGVFIFEDPYLIDILEKTSYDQIYDEHVFYFSITSLAKMFDKYDLEIFDVKRINVHGGSMRYYVAQKDTKHVSVDVEKMSEVEKYNEVDKLSTYQNLKTKIERSKEELNNIIRKIKTDGKRIVGYGATSKSTTITNFCGIGPDEIDFISDTTPIKQDKYSPGTHIPVKRYEEFKECYPDYALLFAWNHAEEIMAKEEEFTKAGGKWIMYVPNIEVIDDIL